MAELTDRHIDPWPALAVDLAVPGLMAGLFGTRLYMARRAGQVKSPAKAAASRANSARGGRPTQIRAKVADNRLN